MTAENLPERRKAYSPADTAAVRAETIGAIVQGQAALLRKRTDKTDLNDTEAVREVSAELMAECAKSGILPSFEMLAAVLGYNRRWLYTYLDKHPDSQTAEFLNRLQTAWAGMRVAAADRGAVDATTSIFVLLNSNQGYTNRHDVLVETAQQGPLDMTDTDIERTKQKYLEAISYLDDEE